MEVDKPIDNNGGVEILAAKKDPSKNTSLIVNQIVVKAPVRNTVDIDTWRQALRQADRGRMARLFNLYDDLLLDNVLSDAISKRVEAITNAELVFANKSGKEVPVMSELIDTIEFEDLVIEILNAKFWGYSVIEMDFSGDIPTPYLIPRKNINIKEGEYTREEMDERGTPYRGDDMIIEVHRPRDRFGLILNAAPYVIYKRGNFGDWAQYTEVFGMPFQVAKYNNYDESTREQLIRALEEAGARRQIIVPKESDIEFKVCGGAGGGDLYNLLCGACNQEILVGILGQTMTTLNGSSKSQGEVHLEIQENKHKSDRRFVERILNTKLVPLLAKRGFPVEGGYFNFPEAGENISLKDRVLIDQAIINWVDVPKSYIYDTYGIPVPAKGEEVVTARSTTPAYDDPIEDPDDPDDDPTEDPEGDDPEDPDNRPPRRSRASTRDLLRNLIGFFVRAPYTGAYSGTIPTAVALKPNPADDFTQRLLGRISRGESPYFDAELFEHLASRFIQSLDKGLSGRRIVNLEPAYSTRDEVMRTALETNLYHFSAAKTLAECQQLNQIARDSKSAREFVSRAQSVTNTFNRKWAETEYINTTLTAEGLANYYNLKANTDIYPYWKYVTAGDGNVREEHRRLDGLILPAENDAWDRIYPPNGWRCRCIVVGVMQHEAAGVDFKSMQGRVEEYYQSATYKKGAAQGFSVNRADVKEVFASNQFYIKKFPTKASKLLNKIQAKDYGLEAPTRLQAAAERKAPIYQGEAQGWFDARRQGDCVILTDRNDRSLSISRSTFVSHTTKSHTNRVPFLDCIEDAVKHPDEVWVNSEKDNDKSFNNYKYFKFYQDRILVVSCQIDRGGVNQLRTWFPLYMKKEVIEKQRRGLLVYNKKPSTKR